jgi:hypothetical protein
MEVGLDTGCDVIWFPTTGCKSNGSNTEACRDPKLQYDPKKSKVSRYYGGFGANRYNVKLYLRGGLYTDTVKVIFGFKLKIIF